jgi:hypothetical protein
MAARYLSKSAHPVFEASMAIDLTRTIKELREQLDHVTQAIAGLEAMSAASRPALEPAGKRGRKSMGAGERNVVSERMKKYWAQRRDRGATHY